MTIIKSVVSLFTFLLVNFGSGALAGVANSILADHENFQYTGRVDFSDSRAPKLSWPGTTIKANFVGRSLSVILDDEHGKNYFSVFIDEDWDRPVIIKCVKGLKTYFVAEGLSEGEHSLTIFKRTEGEEGNTVFKGVLINQGQLTAPSARPLRRIEFIGDSITSGMGNEAPVPGPDDILAEKNNFLAYGAITARALNAEYVSTSQSGIGIMVSWFDFTMPDFFDQLNATGNNDSSWDFSQWVPNVVVINLFQNDSWLVEERLKPIPDDLQRIRAYYDFVQSVRSKYPDALIVCTLGSMDAAKVNGKWTGYISRAVVNFKKANKDNRIETLFFDYEGFDAHPRVEQHQKNAEKLSEFIEERMGW